ADSAYTSDWFTLPDYKGKELLDHKNDDFDYHLAQSRVRIENTIVILKQFSSLHELRTQIRNHKEMKDTIKWIIHCVVLCNVLMSLIQLHWLRTTLKTQTMGYMASYTQLFFPILKNLND
ncbi:hypothetical protein VP01_15307g1, partial [Puccinia sorghi]